MDISSDGPVKTLSYKRLKILHLKYDLHVLLNGAREQTASQDDPRDFGNVMKVDTHVHLSAAMTSKHLLDFIRGKLRSSSYDVVARNKETGVESTLENVFNKLGIDVDSFTLNSLDTRADNTFQRFDHFNAKYNPFGKSELREVFLKSSNFIGGRYYAELTQQLYDKLEKSKHVAAEYRVSIYGSNAREWDELAKWVITHRLYSDRQRWLIQIPRIYSIFRKSDSLQNFEGLIRNIFGPLFEVTINPSSHPELHAFLNQVSGFDSVDDESRPERKFDGLVAETTPDKWSSDENPPYAYYSYYFWANIVALNTLRVSKGWKTFDFRPHAGESGDIEHLASSYLLATNINHGINLDKAIPLQYLYYLSQVGLAVSPLSNNSLFLEYALNPFPKFFKRGLNVSLSTDDPLQFHHTEQPLIEEYATAAQKWELSDGDLSEIARNSILQSGFEHAKKKRWLGEHYLEPGIKGNDISFSNVPNIRISFRQDNWNAEMAFLKKSAATDVKMMETPKDVISHMSHVALSQPSFNESEQDACRMIESAFLSKEKYELPTLTVQEMKQGPDHSATHHYFRLVRGVIHVFEGAIINGKQFVAPEPMISMESIAPFDEFESDLADMVRAFKHSIVVAFASDRLRLLDNKFGFHTLLNGALEKELMRSIPTDFAHITKVDNHIRLQYSMLARHFIKFVKNKVKKHGSDVVINSNGRSVTLASLYTALNIPIDNLTVDALYVRTESGLTQMEDASIGSFVYPTTEILDSNLSSQYYGRSYPPEIAAAFSQVASSSSSSSAGHANAQSTPQSHTHSSSALHNLLRKSSGAGLIVKDKTASSNATMNIHVTTGGGGGGNAQQQQGDLDKLLLDDSYTPPLSRASLGDTYDIRGTSTEIPPPHHQQQQQQEQRYYGEPQHQLDALITTPVASPMEMVGADTYQRRRSLSGGDGGAGATKEPTPVRATTAAAAEAEAGSTANANNSTPSAHRFFPPSSSSTSSHSQQQQQQKQKQQQQQQPARAHHHIQTSSYDLPVATSSPSASTSPFSNNNNRATAASESAATAAALMMDTPKMSQAAHTSASAASAPATSSSSGARTHSPIHSFSPASNHGQDLSSTALWHLYNLFLMSDNDIEGRYFAELSREVFVKRSRNPHILHEFRLIFIGRNRHEWDRLAKWVVANELTSPLVQWIIELPPSYAHLRKRGMIHNLQEYLDNLFIPLLEVSKDPALHPELAQIMPNISGFFVPHVPQQGSDQKVEHMSPLSYARPDQPPLTYLMYYYWANLYTLNAFRKTKRLHCLALRASTDTSAHSVPKAALFCLTSVIHNADLVLRNSPVLTYLCYLAQQGLTISPLASNARISHYNESLFMALFKQGHKVSLSSDNPLQLHMTNEPLNEEYAIASHMWKLSNCDLSEIARNSVLISGFSFTEKSERIGETFYVTGVQGNDSAKTNIPNIRIAYREATLVEELKHLKSGSLSRTPSNADLQSYYAPD